MLESTLFLRQSSAIPYRLNDGMVEVLLITSTKHQHWIVPKGWIAWGFSAADSAVKEAWEEAGVTGRVLTPAFAVYPDRKWGYPCQVEVFLLSVEVVRDEWPEANKRRRQWLSLPDAVKQAKGKPLKRLLQRLQEQSNLLNFVEV
ncbi:MAG: NUDIX hydrolase [Leptolyngbya sp. BL-A-14]